MNLKRRRQRSARLLLSVFAAMLLMMSLHVHTGASVATWDGCYECVNHLPHGGHLSAHVLSIHDCVLCQLMTVSYVPALILVLFRPLTAVLKGTTTGATACMSRGAFRFMGRAPPALS